MPLTFPVVLISLISWSTATSCEVGEMYTVPSDVPSPEPTEAPGSGINGAVGVGVGVGVEGGSVVGGVGSTGVFGGRVVVGGSVVGGVVTGWVQALRPKSSPAQRSMVRRFILPVLHQTESKSSGNELRTLAYAISRDFGPVEQAISLQAQGARPGCPGRPAARGSALESWNDKPDGLTQEILTPLAHAPPPATGHRSPLAAVASLSGTLATVVLQPL